MSDARALADVPTETPPDEEELRGALARAAAARRRVVPVGLGTKLPWARPEAAAGGADLLLSTRALDRVLDYVPGDGTVTAQAGCTMARLAEVVREGGHALTPAVPLPADATLGGTLGAGQSGIDRDRYGPIRHHVLGARVLLADGTRARSGGKLVKNVTGFDLHRLYTGSRGTLCILLEASLRLFPEPQATCALTLEGEGPAALSDAAERARSLPSPPLCTVLESVLGSGWRLHVVLAGRAGQVAAERAEARERLAGAIERDGDDARAHLALLRDLERAGGGWPQLRVGCAPSRTGAALDGLRRSLPDALVVASPASGVASARSPELAGAPPQVQIERALALQGELAARGVRLEPMALDPAVHAALAPSLSAGGALAWMERLRAALDPHGCFRSPAFPARP